MGEDKEAAEKVFLEVDQPLSAQMYSAGNGAIDHHNRVRAKELRIEKRMVTQKWNIRTNFGLLAMTFTDAWLLYKAARGEALDLNANKFFEKLAEEMIDVNFDTRSQTRRAAALSRELMSNVDVQEVQRPTKKRRTGKPSQLKQNNCAICNLSCTYVCHCCSQDQDNEVFVCRPKSGRKCWQQHLRDVHKK